MKIFIAVPLIAAAAFAATSFHLWRELADARAQLSASVPVARQPARISAQPQENRGWPRLQSAAPQPSRPAAGAVMSAQVVSSSAGPGLILQGQTGSRPQVRVDSPATARMARNQERANMRRMYQDLAHELGLSAEETNKFYDLLSEQQRRGVIGLERADPRIAGEQVKELLRQRDAEIAGLIGGANLGVLKEYQNTMNARFEVDAIRNQLTFAELPLTDAQRKRLIQATVDDQQLYPRPAYAPGMSPTDMTQMNVSWEREHTERQLAVAKQVLTADQYQYYEDNQRSQLEMQEQALLHPGKDIVFSNGSMTMTRGAAQEIIEGDPAQYSTMTTTTP